MIKIKELLYKIFNMILNSENNLEIMKLKVGYKIL